MIGSGDDEDPVGRAGDVLVVEPDAHTVLPGLLDIYGMYELVIESDTPILNPS